MNLSGLYQAFAKAGIRLSITKKCVKNINFCMKLGECHVSVPTFASEEVIILAIYARLSWAKQANERLCQVHAQPQRRLLTLWGKPHDLPDDDTEVLNIYRQHLSAKIPMLQSKWQPIVGQSAHTVRLRKMKTRWGTCHLGDRRIWLSVYLAAYPYECTEYVFVHELCHLIHANHGTDFWSEVKKAMPDYQRWHGLLKGRA
ncbi:MULTISPECIES: M48 family metallopeptidase [unclassified Moraxella]|uniref:M48 family metallopeptidase n=1 Tax=unclassified Moraxella TaxID=2685852 RepID=UPI002B411134|nr:MULTISPECIES: YgjP-like metallopeptidase domain-containing protein [unclassified Moraxella]